MIQAFVSYMFIFADVADNFVKFYFGGLVMAVGLNSLLNPILISHKIYASLLYYSTTFKVFSYRCSVKDNKIYHKFVTIFCKHA